MINLNIFYILQIKDHYWVYIDDVDVIELDSSVWDGVDTTNITDPTYGGSRSFCLQTIQTRVAGYICYDCIVLVYQNSDSHFHVDSKPGVSYVWCIHNI